MNTKRHSESCTVRGMKRPPALLTLLLIFVAGFFLQRRSPEAVGFAAGDGCRYVDNAIAAENPSHCEGAGNCFVAGTLVATPSGDRPIESLAAGDMVLARSEVDDTVSARPIVRTFARGAGSLVDVRILTIDGERERVQSTPEHPYFTLDRGWVRADDLVPNEPLLDRSGREVRVTRVVPIAQEAVVYNLEVDVDHTYFVGHASVWVHNQCPVDDGPSWPGRHGRPGKPNHHDKSPHGGVDRALPTSSSSPSANRPSKTAPSAKPSSSSSAAPSPSATPTASSSSSSTIPAASTSGSAAPAPSAPLPGTTEWANKKWNSSGPKSPGSDNFIDHYKKHKDEFPGMTQTEYAEEALRIKNRPEGIQYKKKGNDKYYYDSSTDTLVIVNNGKIKTMFKPGHGRPGKGQAYFDKQ